MAGSRSYDSARDGALSTTEPLELAIASREGHRHAEHWQSRFASGRSVEGRSHPDGSDQITVRADDGRVELEVTLTEKGPVLHFRAAEMTLQAEGRLALACEDLEVHARRSIVQESGGDLVQVAGRDSHISARRELCAHGTDARIESTRGDVVLRANDDVRLHGERVKLNC